MLRAGCASRSRSFTAVRAGGHLRAAGCWCCVNSFNTDRTFGWPPPGFTLHWWQLAWHSQGARDALLDQSVKVACAGDARSRWCSGTLAAMALRRTRFFGRNVVSLLIILPIALPGIVTGLALPERLPHHPRHPAVASGRS